MEPPLAELCVTLGARAAGLWRREGDHLIQVAFAAGPGLDPDVAERFAQATLRVPLDRVDLGIVKAATTGQVAVSVAAELTPEAGSGYWLRAFGAGRSIAVPLLDSQGKVHAVASVAVPEECQDEALVVERLRGFGLI